MQLGADGGNAGGDLIRSCSASMLLVPIITTTTFGLTSSNSPCVSLQSDVLGAVPAVAKVHDATAREESVPLVHPGSPAANRLAAPEMRDGVAKHHDFRLAALHQRGRGRVAVRPVVDLKITVLRDRHERGRRSRAGAEAPP